MVEDQVCEDDKEVRNENIDIFPYQMNCDDNFSQYPTYPNLDLDVDHITVKKKRWKLIKLPLKSNHVVIL